MSKRGLGKGLGALISASTMENALEFNPEKDLLREIDIETIKPNANQPRKDFNPQKLAELTASIKEHGLVQPIVVRPYQEFYQIVAGERRYRACQQLGLKKMSAIIKDLSDAEVTQISLIENIQRQELNPIEEARAYEVLLNKFELTQEEIAKKVSKSRPFIANSLRLLNLAPQVSQMLENGELTVGHARALLALDQVELQLKLAKKIQEQGLTVRETERLVKSQAQSSRKPMKKKQHQKNTVDPVLNDLEEHLQDRFGTKVIIKNRGQAGKIEIEFYNASDLERIIDMLIKKI